MLLKKLTIREVAATKEQMEPQTPIAMRGRSKGKQPGCYDEPRPLPLLAAPSQHQLQLSNHGVFGWEKKLGTDPCTQPPCRSTLDGSHVS